MVGVVDSWWPLTACTFRVLRKACSFLALATCGSNPPISMLVMWQVRLFWRLAPSMVRSWCCMALRIVPRSSILCENSSAQRGGWNLTQHYFGVGQLPYALSICSMREPVVWKGASAAWISFQINWEKLLATYLSSHVTFCLSAVCPCRFFFCKVPWAWPWDQDMALLVHCIVTFFTYYYYKIPKFSTGQITGIVSINAPLNGINSFVFMTLYAQCQKIFHLSVWL